MSIDILIYIYVTICILFIIYNISYVCKQKTSKIIRERKTAYWRKQLQIQFDLLEETKQIETNHISFITRRLTSINNLIAFIDALSDYHNHTLFSLYLNQIYLAQQQLAYKYLKKSDMEKSYFAYTLSIYASKLQTEYPPLLTILIEYLDSSSVYCRENTLKALFTIGNIHAVETAFQYLNDSNIHHNTKLLSDGLITFQGDKQALAKQLWKHINDWNEELMISIVKFISLFSGDYTEEFFPYVNSSSTHLELKLEMLRYYRRYYYEPIQELLHSFLTNDTNTTLSIVSASVLCKYPSKETIDVLKKACSHSNWYIRYNAANSLISLIHSVDDVLDILQGSDTFAKDIVRYMLEQEGMIE